MHARNHTTREKRLANARAIAAQEADRLGLRLDVLAKTGPKGALRTGPGGALSLARRRLWVAMRDRGVSLPLIAAATGARDHTSVLCSLRRGGAA